MSGRRRPLQRYADYRPPLIVPFHEADAARRYRRSVRNHAQIDRTSSGASEMSSVGSSASAASSDAAASTCRSSSTSVAPSEASAITASSISSGSSIPVTPVEENISPLPTPLIDAMDGRRVEEGVIAGNIGNRNHAALLSTSSPSKVLHDSRLPTTSFHASSKMGSSEKNAAEPSNSFNVGVLKSRTIPPFAAMDELRALSGIPAIYCPTKDDNVDRLFDGFGSPEDHEEAEEEVVDNVKEERSILESCERITSDLRRLRVMEAAREKEAAERFKKWTMKNGEVDKAREKR